MSFFKSKLIPLLIVLALLVTSPSALAESPKVGVVLGGGAARGFSHIGLLKAFEEEGIPVDILVGTSMGSIISGLYAYGLSIDNLIYLANNLDMEALFTPTFPPKGGILDTSGIHRFFNYLTEGATFDDLVIPFYSVITELVSGEELALNHGLLSRGIVASMSIPGMFPPVEIDGGYYADGGMKNAVPANVAKDKGSDIVIAVDVKRALEHIEHDNLITNLQLTIYLMVGGYVDINIEYADLVIVPDVLYDSYMDYGRAEYFIQEGYVAGKKAIPAIKELILSQDPNFDFTQTPKNKGMDPEAFSDHFQKAIEYAVTSSQGLSIKLDPVVILPHFSLNPSIGYSWDNLFAGLDLKQESPSSVTLKLGLGHLKKSYGAVFLRKYGEEDALTYGILGGLAKDGPLNAYGEVQLSQPMVWKLSLNAALLEILSIRQNLTMEIGKDHRREETGDQFYLELSPRWKIPLTSKGVDVVEAAQVHPYWLVEGGALFTSPFALDQMSWELGTGLNLDIKLFGLYPIETDLKVIYHGGSEPGWSWGWYLYGGR